MPSKSFPLLALILTSQFLPSSAYKLDLSIYEFTLHCWKQNRQNPIFFYEDGDEMDADKVKYPELSAKKGKESTTARFQKPVFTEESGFTKAPLTPISSDDIRTLTVSKFHDHPKGKIRFAKINSVIIGEEPQYQDVFDLTISLTGKFNLLHLESSIYEFNRYWYKAVTYREFGVEQKGYEDVFCELSEPILVEQNIVKSEEYFK